jgi:hypothetical protein
MAGIASSGAQIRELEVRIAALEQIPTEDASQSCRRLKTQRNALTPLGHLPTDVLADIAGHLLVPTPADTRSDYGIVDVCRSIRCTLKATPLLWIQIDLRRSVHWCTLCIERAGEAALTLSFTPPWFDSEEKWPEERYEAHERLFVQTLPRAAHVQVCMTALPNSLMGALLQSSRPLLRSLELRTFSMSATLDSRVNALCTLRTLVLDHVCIPCDGVQLPLLEHLELRQHWGGPLIQLAHVWELVHGALNFRSLVITGYQPRSEDDDVVLRPQPVRPQSLRSISLDIGPIREGVHSWALILAFVRGLPVPPNDCVVYFESWGQRHDLTTRTWFAGLMCATLAHPAMRVQHSVQDCYDTVALACEFAGTKWTISMRYSRNIFWFLEDVYPRVATLDLGNAAASLFLRDVINHLGSGALPDVHHVLIEDAQSDLSHLKQWLHARVYAERRVHTVEFHASLVYPDEWALAVLKRDIVEMKLAKVMILEDGKVCTVPEG